MEGCILTSLAIVVLAAVVWMYSRAQAQARALRTLEDRLDTLASTVAQRLGRLERQGAVPDAADAETGADYTRPPAVTAAAASGGAPQPRVAAQPTPPTPTPAGPPAAPPPSPPSSPPPVAPPSAPPPSAPPPSAPPPAPPSARLPKIEWERWIGVRGFAVLGGAVLALAGLLFVKELADRGYFPPEVRVALAYLAGIGSVVGSEALRRRAYAPAANGLAGAGVVILYAATWAASRLFSLIGFGVGYAIMALVTAAAGLLAWRHRSAVIAGLGLVGGLLTPLLLGSRFDQPIGLFGYLLLLDGALLALVRRRGWPLLAGVGLLGTVLYLAAWALLGLGPGDRGLALVLLALFAGLFGMVGVAAGRGGTKAKEIAAWPVVRAFGLAMPFAFALYFAARADLGRHLAPTAALLAVLSLAAGLLERRRSLPAGATAAAAVATLAVFGVWAARSRFDLALAWEAAGLAAGLAGVFTILLELRRRTGDASETEDAAPAAIAAFGLLGILALAAPESRQPLWPWLAGWTALAAMLVRIADVMRIGWLHALTAAASALALAFFLVAGAAPDDPLLAIGVAVAAGAAWQVLALARRQAEAGLRAREAGAFVFALIALAGAVPLAAALDLDARGFVATTAAFTVLAILPATRAGAGSWYLGAVAMLSLDFLAAAALHGMLRGDAWMLAGHGALVVLLTVWPFVAGRTLVHDRWALYGAALAGPLAFPALHDAFVPLFGRSVIGALPLALAAVALAGALLARRALEAGSAARQRSQAWLLAVAIGFVALAVPLQLDREWWTIAWALQGAALLALWRRIDHPGLKLFAAVLLAAAVVRLVVNPAVLGYHRAGGGLPVLNWLLYTYGVPAAALIVSFRLLHGREVARARPLEAQLYASGRPWLALGCALSAIVVVFVWINLTITDLFADGPQLSLSLTRHPARDLSLSIAWAAYALILLALGLRAGSKGLRWISLIGLLLTIVKVFLFDLGNLRDLYRVASLAGLAISLLLVSLIYQRFVFGRGEENDDAPS